MNPGQNNREKLLKFLKELPEEQFDYSVYFAREGCGTVGCVAGWCAEKFAPDGNRGDRGCDEFSSEFLKLTRRESDFLFVFLCGSAKLSDAIKRLQWLVDHGSFEGYPIHEESWVVKKCQPEVAFAIQRFRNLGLTK